MKITCYFINWNDSFYLPFLHKHYSKFCQRIVMYDQYSTDNSRQIARSLGFEIREFGSRSQLNDQWYLDVKNNCWKEERGKDVDYVIVVDVDEFLAISGFGDIHPRGQVTAPIVRGYNMISEKLPVNDIFEVNTGGFSESYSKQAIFNPDAIDEIHYVHGCHKNHINGKIDTGGPVWNLFHFRQIGGLDRMLGRHAQYRRRLSKFNLRHNMGFHYGRPEWTLEELRAFNATKLTEWKELQDKATDLW